MLDRAFIDALASKAPTPGGGGASAYVGALASALATMVGNLTVGKKKYADVEAEVYMGMERLEALRERLIELVDEDADAFGSLAAAYGLPKGSPEEIAVKNTAMQTALVGACEVPLEIMQCIVKVIKECEFLGYHGSRLALSDVGVAVAFAKAALQGASLNIYINAGSIEDQGRARKYREELGQMLDQAIPIADRVYEYVVKEIQ